MKVDTVIFGKIPKREWDNEADFKCIDIKSNKEKHYYYKLQLEGVMDDSQIVISDTCGRYVPIHTDELDVLIESLKLLRKSL